jgi:glucose-1-phosphate adenylyltransferase
MAYNGVTVEGEVENSILFPGVRIEAGARVRDSVLFFNTVVRRDARLDRVVCDVNTSFGVGAQVGGSGGKEEAITVIGWNNQVPAGQVIGRGCTVYPHIDGGNWPSSGLADGEVLQ